MTAAAHHRSTEINYRDLLVSSVKSTLAAFEHTYALIEWANDRAETVGDVDPALVEPLLDPAGRVVAALAALDDAVLQIEAVSPHRESVFDSYRRSTSSHPAFGRGHGPRRNGR